MKFESVITVMLLIGLFTGCQTTPSYQAKKIDSVFMSEIKSTKKLSVVQFDAFVGDELNGSGSILQLFGALGVIADSVIDKSDEAFGINLQNESIRVLNEELGKINSNYVPTNLMETSTVVELTKRFKSNRLWGMRGLKKESLTKYFDQHKNIDFAVHVKSFAANLLGELLSESDWVIYDRKLSKVAEINTRSVEDLSGKTYSNEQLFKKTMSLQKKNISEFIKIISRNSLNSR